MHGSNYRVIIEYHWVFSFASACSVHVVEVYRYTWISLEEFGSSNYCFKSTVIFISCLNKQFE